MTRAILRGWTLALAAGVVCGTSWGASAHLDDSVAYPADYRQWVHVKSTIVGPEARGAERNGGLHHFYANQLAMAGYRDGLFPDGSVLVDELLELRASAPGITSEGPRRRLSVMRKDAKRFPDTAGWGFEEFPGDAQTGTLSSDRRSACLTCHAQGRDGVMTRLRP